MQRLWLLAVVAVAVAPVGAAPGRGNPRDGLAGQKGPLLSRQTLQALARPITRQQQLRSLQGGPPATQEALAAGLAAITTSARSLTDEATAFRNGVVLTPLAACYPAAPATFCVDVDLSEVCINGFCPLPTSAQKPPVVYVFCASKTDSLVGVRLWPVEPGAYMVTFTLTGITGVPDSPQLDLTRFGGAADAGTQSLPIVPLSGGVNATQWTVLVDLSAKADWWMLRFRPGAQGFYAFSSVTIREL